MKCPSKEIDKNNISLLLPKTTISQIVSLKSQHSLCLFLLVVLSCVCVTGFFFFSFFFLFLQSMAVWCVLWWNERDHWGTLRSVLRDPFMSSFVKPGWEAARMVSSSQTLGPDVHTHRDPHPLLLCSNLLQPLFHYCLARPGAVWTERASSGYLGLIALKVAASNLLDQFKDPHNSPRLHWLHSGSALDSVKTSWPMWRLVSKRRRRLLSPPPRTGTTLLGELFSGRSHSSSGGGGYWSRNHKRMQKINLSSVSPKLSDEEVCPSARASKQKLFLLLSLWSNKRIKTLRMKVQVVYFLFPH